MTGIGAENMGSSWKHYYKVYMLERKVGERETVLHMEVSDRLVLLSDSTENNLIVVGSVDNIEDRVEILYVLLNRVANNYEARSILRMADYVYNMTGQTDFRIITGPNTAEVSADERTVLQKIVDMYPDEEILKADGFDDAIIGIETSSMRLIYSVGRCIEILASQGMTDEEAIEFFEYNVSGSYVGERTPIWCNDEY